MKRAIIIICCLFWLVVIKSMNYEDREVFRNLLLKYQHQSFLNHDPNILVNYSLFKRMREQVKKNKPQLGDQMLTFKKRGPFPIISEKELFFLFQNITLFEFDGRLKVELNKDAWLFLGYARPLTCRVLDYSYVDGSPTILNDITGNALMSGTSYTQEGQRDN